MGSITSGVGLVSGMDYQSLVDQLLAIDARPRDQVIARMGRLDAQRTAYADLTARISAMIAHLNNLSRPATFRNSAASSSNESVLTATAGTGAAPGAYQFSVLSLATTHQLVSGRFRAADEPLGLGSFTVESGAARVNRSTRLDELNGGQGISRGSIRLQDRTGATADVDLRDALSLEDVVTRINAAGIGVRAAVRSDALVLTDSTTGTGAMLVQEIDGGTTATELGLLNSAPANGVITGRSLMYMTSGTSLSTLRDGLGLRTSRGGDDFRIAGGSGEFQVDLSGLLKVDTRLQRLNSGRGVELGNVRLTTRDGVQTEVDLTGALTVADIQQRLQTVNGVSVTVSGQGLVVVDGTTTSTNSTGFKIEDLTGHAARDLGIAGSADAQTEPRVTGRRVLQVATVADVLAAVNYATGNDGTVVARIAADGQRIEIQNNGSGVRLSPGQSRTLEDLGLSSGDFQDQVVTGQRIVGGANTVLLSSLNGGSGLALGAMTISSGSASVQVDLSGAQTLAQAVDTLQQAADANGLAVDIGYERSGTRLRIASRDGVSTLTASGAAADALGLAGSGVSLRGANLQRRYVSENTTLSSLNQGRGVSLGTLRITNGAGASAVLNLQSNPPQTLQDVIDAIGALNISVRAEINATGDGLRLIDDSTGAGRLLVADESGTAARDLNIAGESSGPPGARAIDGSFEYLIDAGASGTLNDLATRIGRTNLAQAGVLNDGGATNPFRLNITSRATGVSGELIIESDDPLLNFTTLTRAQDALVSAGGVGGAGILITSSSNQIENTVGGLNLDLHRTSSEPVTIEVSQNVDAALEAIKSLVEGFNAAIERVAQNSSFDVETEQRGILLGEFAPREAQRRLFNLFTQFIPGASGVIRRLSDAGLKIGAGSKLEFNEEKFREAYAADPEAVVSFFTDAEQGAGKYISDALKDITDPDGLLDRRSDTLGDIKESLQDRVDRYNQRLARKREQLLRKFQSMEQTLALLQGQQASLSSFSPLPQPSGNQR